MPSSWHIFFLFGDGLPVVKRMAYGLNSHTKYARADGIAVVGNDDSLGDDVRIRSLTSFLLWQRGHGFPGRWARVDQCVDVGEDSE
jgi:hypothetical protein